MGVLGFINVYFEFIWKTILDLYSSIIISINGLDIMVTLNSVYFEYIKILCKIFAKYIMPTLKVYPNHFFVGVIQVVEAQLQKHVHFSSTHFPFWPH